MFGESRATVNHGIHPDAMVELTECPGGHTVTLTEQFPRTDLDALPRAIVSAHDFTGDGVQDHQIRTELAYEDVNGNGLIERGVDRLRLRHTEASVIQRETDLVCGSAQRLAASARVVGKLGGVLRV